MILSSDYHNITERIASANKLKAVRKLANKLIISTVNRSVFFESLMIELW